MPAYDPWRALRGRDDVTIARRALPDECDGGLIALASGRVFIVLDETLLRPERNAALTHEVVHLERGLLPDDAPAHVVAKEERRVEQEAARRLVPFEDLDELHLRAVVSGEQIALWDVAKRFGVPEAVAELAVAMWAAEQGIGVEYEDEWSP